MADSPKILSRHLRGACPRQRGQFKVLFPDGAPITLRAARKAQRAGLSVTWLAALLTGERSQRYCAHTGGPPTGEDCCIRMLVSLLREEFRLRQKKRGART